MIKHILLLTGLFIFNGIAAQEWEQVASMPRGADDARHHPVTFSIDGYGYVLTGGISGGAANDFMRYEAASDTWEILPDFPGAARSFSYGTTRGSKAYVGFGGFDGMRYNDMWEYDSTTEEWTELTACPCDPRYHPAFVQLEDKIFVGMGNNPSNLKDWWEYDIPTNAWTQKNSLPGPERHHPFYFGIDNVAYVGFGHGNRVNGETRIFNDFYKFDPATDEWEQMEDFPGEARVAGTQFDYNGKGYVLSGDGDDHSFMEEGEFWEYEPLTDTWTQLTSHPGSSRWAPGNFVIDNFVYLLGGLSDVQLESDMWRFELEPIFSSTDESNTSPIAIFPNPVDDILTIDEDLTQYSTVQLVNSFGQAVMKVTSNQVDVSSLIGGVYYLQLYKDEGMLTEKVVVW